MRNEQKFLGSYNYFRAKLLASGFRQSHGDRIVTSVYFDTIGLEDFWDGEEGSVPRTKTRVRYYGNTKLPAKCQLERKITYENSRDKEVFPLDFFDIKESQEMIFRRFARVVVPIVKVSYQRAYFVDQSDNRATLDTRITYDKLAENGESLYRMPDQTNILEIKSSLIADESLILSEFQNLRSRFSKYCTGVRLCLGINS